MTWSVYGKSLGRTYILVILQLEVTFKLQSKQRDTVNWGRKWLANFNAGNTQPISLDISIRVLPSYRNQSIDLHSKSGFYMRANYDVKINMSNLDEKLSFKMLRLSLFSKVDWGFYVASIAKNASGRIGASIW